MTAELSAAPSSCLTRLGVTQVALERSGGSERATRCRGDGEGAQGGRQLWSGCTDSGVSRGRQTHQIWEGQVFTQGGPGEEPEYEEPPVSETRERRQRAGPAIRAAPAARHSPCYYLLLTGSQCKYYDPLFTPKKMKEFHT